MAARRTAAGPIPVTVTELVRSGLLSRHRMMAWRFARGHGVSVSDAIEAVSLKADAKKPVSRLSGGQQRRALLARALVGGSRLLLLDEPTEGLLRSLWMKSCAFYDRSRAMKVYQ